MTVTDSTPPPRYTVLRERHEALGASFTDFGGWMMPVRYSSDLAEHRAVREAAGLFDVSHMAEFSVEGADAAAYLDDALAGRHSTMPLGKAKYGLLLSEDGGIIDDLIVYRLAEGRFLVIANAGNRDAVGETLADRVGEHAVQLEDVSDRWALLALQGPAAAAILDELALDELDTPLDELRYYAAARGRFAGHDILVARTGYTGEDGFELLLPPEAAGALWDALLVAGADSGLVPAGLAARDTLRLEAGMPLYGHELSLDIAPAQAGLSRVVAADKEHFVGKDGLAARAADPAAPVLVGLSGQGKRAARAGYAVLADDTEGAIGTVTSGALSPTLGHPIAMAFVIPAASTLGTDVIVDVRGTRIPMTVTELPFYRRKK